MQRHEARLAELRGTDVENRVTEIDVGQREAASLRHAEPSRGEQAEERRVGRAAQTPARAERSRGGDERGNLCVSIDVMKRPSSRRPRKPSWRYFVGRIDRGTRQGERTDAVDPAPGKPSRPTTRKHNPAQDQGERQRPAMALRV